jgi:hypothetical protein
MALGWRWPSTLSVEMRQAVSGHAVLEAAEAAEKSPPARLPAWMLGKRQGRDGDWSLESRIVACCTVEMMVKYLFGMLSSPHDMQPGVLEFSPRPLNGGS